MLRAAGVCGLLALVTVSVGWIGGALAQPDAYNSADDHLSDLGALTANKAWIYNQIGDNLAGILIILFGLGLWLAVRPSVLGQIGAGAVMLTGFGVFLEQREHATDEVSEMGRSSVGHAPVWTPSSCLGIWSLRGGVRALVSTSTACVPTNLRDRVDQGRQR